MLGTSLNPLASNQGALANQTLPQKYYQVQLYTSDMRHQAHQQNILTNHQPTGELVPKEPKISIGIENVGGAKNYPLTEAQVEANNQLIRYLAVKHDITHVIGQSSEQDTSIQKTNIVVYMDYVAVYGLDSAVVSDSFTIGNLIPEIIEIYAPDTIIRPEGTTFDFELISAKAFDPENDINWVGFTSFWIDSAKMMNNGNYIYLYDDGSSVVLYQPNVTSGDVMINDGIYSFNIPIYGSEILDTNLQTKTGLFKWEFIVQDEAGEYSKIKEHNVFIKQINFFNIIGINVWPIAYSSTVFFKIF